jgi:hypothetical protein
MKTVEVNMLKSGIYVYGYLRVDTGERKIDVSEGGALLQNDYICARRQKWSLSRCLT